ncbi:hypothetical protein SAMN05216474_0942 [Lishizhenia tianjinensis]|uniref:Uncharacterized protein n=1 Tax=Lishizhenia tianjinensis TaxID=477690 RepID=A0A1I6YJM4_9FLAO|nr:hypothetical protein [Lishizhenia tianjinensis]SFT50544.1 hypothetical protein SAMN05216474_0942 [Lishizhenia tianjinensis]
MNKLLSILALSILINGSLLAQAKSGLGATFELVNDTDISIPQKGSNSLTIGKANFWAHQNGNILKISKYVNSQRVLKVKFPFNAGEYKRISTNGQKFTTLGDHILEIIKNPNGKTSDYYVTAINTDLEVVKTLQMASVPKNTKGSKVKYFEKEGHLIFVQYARISSSQQELTITALNQDLEKIELDKYTIDVDENSSAFISNIEIYENFLTATHQIFNEKTGNSSACSFKQYSLDGDHTTVLELGLPKDLSTIYTTLQGDQLYLTGFTHDQIAHGTAGKVFHAKYSIENQKLINYDEQVLGKEFIENLYNEEDLNKAKNGRNYDHLNYKILESYLLDDATTLTVAEHYLTYTQNVASTGVERRYIRKGIVLIKTNKEGKIIWTKHLDRHMHSTEDGNGAIYQRLKDGQLHLIYQFDYYIIASLVDIKNEEVETSVVFDDKESKHVLPHYDEFIELEKNKIAISCRGFVSANALIIDFDN